MVYADIRTRKIFQYAGKAFALHNNRAHYAWLSILFENEDTNIYIFIHDIFLIIITISILNVQRWNEWKMEMNKKQNSLSHNITAYFMEKFVHIAQSILVRKTGTTSISGSRTHLHFIALLHTIKKFELQWTLHNRCNEAEKSPQTKWDTTKSWTHRFYYIAMKSNMK